jgi:dolichol-phosphate mannosyltransferase
LPARETDPYQIDAASNAEKRAISMNLSDHTQLQPGSHASVLPVIATPIDAVTVIVPVHNEALNVAPLVDELGAAFAAHPCFEVIYVDDGSEDATFQELKRMAQDRPWLRALRQAERCGQSTAIRTGVKASRYDWIVTIDGDGQNDPADIPLLLAVAARHPAQERLQLVAGQRQRRADPWLRRFSSRIANATRSRLLGDRTPDTGCGLKLFRREAFLDLPYFDHMHRFLPALIQRQGGEVVLIEVSHRPRQHGRSHYGIGNRLWIGIVDLLGVLWLKRRFRRANIVNGG